MANGNGNGPNLPKNYEMLQGGSLDRIKPIADKIASLQAEIQKLCTDPRYDGKILRVPIPCDPRKKTIVFYHGSGASKHGQLMKQIDKLNATLAELALGTAVVKETGMAPVKTAPAKRRRKK